jgi:hypothetical protein
MATIKKPSAYQAGGTVKSTPKAADKSGDYITVQKRNLPPKDVKTSVPKKAKSGAKLATAKGGKWIQKAINPKHKGYCTPETKATCTPRRKALAHTLRKMAKKK